MLKLQPQSCLFLNNPRIRAITDCSLLNITNYVNLNSFMLRQRNLRDFKHLPSSRLMYTHMIPLFKMENNYCCMILHIICTFFLFYYYYYLLLLVVVVVVMLLLIGRKSEKEKKYLNLRPYCRNST